VVALGEMLRAGANDQELIHAVQAAVGRRPRDGHLVESGIVGNNLISMARIGG